MKNLRKFILALSFLFFICSPAIVLAQANLIQTRGENQNESGQATETGVMQKEIVREEVQEKTATVQAFLSERKQEFVRNRFTLVTRRMEAATNRFYLLISRLESRLAKIEKANKNVDTETMGIDIASAKEKLAEVTTQLEEVEGKMGGTLQSENPQENFVEVKTMISETKETLVGVYQILVKIVDNIKGLNVENSSTDSAVME